MNLHRTSGSTAIRAAIVAAVLLTAVAGCQASRPAPSTANGGNVTTRHGGEGFSGSGDAPIEQFGSWLVTEMGYEFPLASRCVALTLPVNNNSFRVEDQETAFVVSATKAYLIHRPGFGSRAIVAAIIGDKVTHMVLEDQQLAGFQPGDDFVFLASLAATREEFFGTTIGQNGVLDAKVFSTQGFRDAYARLGHTCGFDTRPILGY